MAGICAELKEEFSCYLDGELEGGRQTEIANHLAECNDCRQEYEGLKTLSGLFAKGPRSQSLPVPDIWGALSQHLPSTCEVIKEDLSAYLDGELPLPAQEGVNEHLKECKTCAEVFRKLNVTNQLIAKSLGLPANLEVDLWSGVKARLNEDCALIAGELSVFVDQEVATLRHRAITGHLLECASCQAEFGELSRVGDLVRTHYQPVFPENFDLWPGIKREINVIPLNAGSKGATQPVSMAAYRSNKLALVAVAAVAVGLAGTLAFLLNTPSVKPIQMVSAEAYLLESAMAEPGDSAESVVYENQ